jgi:hypothetical protein
MALDDKLARELLPRVKRLCEQHNWNIRDHLGSGASAAVFEVESEGPKLHALKVFAPRFLKGRTGVLVTFYQLGGLLHDLIMKERLFEDVVQRASENRYLIAHAVATRAPVVRTEGVTPIDLVLLAQRALEKDLTRRLALVRWEDFLSMDDQRQSEFILGLVPGRTPVLPTAKNHVPDWASKLLDALDKKLMEANIHCRQDLKTLSNDRAYLELAWTPKNTSLPAGAEISVRIEFLAENGRLLLDSSGVIRCGEESLELESAPIIAIPSADFDEHFDALLVQSYDAFIRVSAEFVKKHSVSQ